MAPRGVALAGQNSTYFGRLGDASVVRACTGVQRWWGATAARDGWLRISTSARSISRPGISRPVACFKSSVIERLLRLQQR
ncbi:MAG TPA: hypothetical protein VI699_03935 [Candidatus Acidoferrales bacterium]|nr:hypothetical protein [Candidatus Acidoferrales bacterium]